MSWLWRSDDTSPASFEKALSKLSTQVTTANLALDKTRTQSRRIKALWTLWTTILYLIFVLIKFFVPSPHSYNMQDYAMFAGGPLTIYGVRKALTFVFDWRIRQQESHVTALQKQREGKIADLKKATKYDSTQELLQKYGGAPKDTTPTKKDNKKKSTPQQTQQRTGLPPPPTANIPGRQLPQQPQVQPPRQIPVPGSPDRMSQSPTHFSPDSPGFAPYAFSNPPSASSSYQQSSHWYDRLLDVMIGEDESAAKNRLALICSNCRLVNGLAPPGNRTLEEVGRWRCSSCGSWNGTDQHKAAREMVESVRRSGGASPTSPSDDNGWEQVAKSEDKSEEAPEVLLGEVEGSTGRQAAGRENDATGSPSAPTKRVTRSMGASEA